MLLMDAVTLTAEAWRQVRYHNLAANLYYNLADKLTQAKRFYFDEKAILIATELTFGRKYCAILCVIFIFLIRLCGSNGQKADEKFYGKNFRQLR